MMLSDQRQGFALPAVLTVTGVVTLIFLVAITALSSLNGEARSARERVRFLESALTAEAAVQYMATTEPFENAGLLTGGPRRTVLGDDTSAAATSADGVSIVDLNGRTYELETGDRAAHPVLISLRDQAGMINIAHLDDIQFARLGALLGLPANVSRSLRALYTDYVDFDDLQTMNGAEQAQYGDEEPANRHMLRTQEMLSLVGVRQAVAATKWRELRDDVVVDWRRNSINVNTSSSRTLEVVFGLSPQQAEAAVEARQRSPFLSMDDFVAVTGASISYEPERVLTFPAGRIVYTIRDTQSAWRYRARLVLTPRSLERPFWVDQTEMTEASGTAMANADATRFPFTPH